MYVCYLFSDVRLGIIQQTEIDLLNKQKNLEANHYDFVLSTVSTATPPQYAVCFSVL